MAEITGNPIKLTKSSKRVVTTVASVHNEMQNSDGPEARRWHLQHWTYFAWLATSWIGCYYAFMSRGKELKIETGRWA
jgi:hypothetical protein